MGKKLLLKVLFLSMWKVNATYFLASMIFEEKTSVIQIVFSFKGKLLFSLSAFKNILSLLFRSLVMISFSMYIFGFTVSGVTQISQSVALFLFLNLGSFYSLFVSFFSSTHFLLFFWDFGDTNIKCCLFIYEVTKALIISFFSLFCAVFLIE